MCVYSYMFKLQSPSKYSSFDAIHLSRLFFMAQNSFWTCRLWWLLPFFSPLSNLQNVSLWQLFFIQINRQKHAVLSQAVFCQKLLNTQHRVGKCTGKSSIMKWANVLKESSEEFTNTKCILSQQCQWYPDTEGLLEHSPSGGAYTTRGLLSRR